MLLLCACCLPLTLHAATDSWVDRSHTRMTVWVSELGRWVDARLSGETVPESNLSRLKLGYGVTLSRLDKPDWKPRIGLDLSLPVSERRLKLFVTRQLNDTSRAPQPEQLGGHASNSSTDDQTFVGIRSIEKRTARILRTLDFGANFHGITPGVFVRWRNRDRQPLTPSWQWTTHLQWLWESDRGLSGRYAWLFDRGLDSRRLWRQRLQLDGYLDSQTLDFTASEELFVWLPAAHSLNGHLSAQWSNQPQPELVWWGPGMNYSRPVLRRWLLLSISPEIAFERQHDYAANARLSLQLTAHFSQ
ncbi:hypothetical protein SAMN05443662_1269 [Sulfurivirga caldicuralii]|uniref:Uncharacterized protein n=2 Tax=Sulfurivirga caldicuralii TaxID=364032 RepID=A0A1N6GB58_9GAMM|nr:hypothetical protein SAMN05443662_1269 [Sulfurivirga caldicuralii]